MNSADAKTTETLEDLVSHAEEGDAGACARAGHLYVAGDPGLGLAPDHERALYFYEKGAALGDLPCLYGLAGCQLQTAPEKAVSLLQQCAERKYIWALATLGDFYLRGRHVAQDAAKARVYLKEYTTLARPDVLGAHTFKVRWDLTLYPLCLALGIGGEKDAQKAQEILSRLAASGNMTALDILTDGVLDDWMTAKRFGHDTKEKGPLPVFSAQQLPDLKQTSNVPANVPAPAPRKMKPRRHASKRARETVAPEKLDRFLQRSLIPGEPVLMRGRFPGIYTLDSFFRLAVCLLFGRWVEHMMAVKADVWIDAVPHDAAVWLYNHPQAPVVLFGLIGFYDFMKRMIKKWTTDIILTDKRFLFKQGFISIKMIQMNYWQIEHSDVRQSLIGSLFDYGRVHIQSNAVQAGENAANQPGGTIVLPPIAHPFLFTRLIEDNRQLPYKMRGGGGRNPTILPP